MFFIYSNFNNDKNTEQFKYVFKKSVVAFAFLTNQLLLIAIISTRWHMDATFRFQKKLELMIQVRQPWLDVCLSHLLQSQNCFIYKCAACAKILN